MKNLLMRNKAPVYHYIDGVLKEGVPTSISGDVTGISGNVSSIWGDVTGLSGNVTSISGDVTGLSGDVSDCDITEDERAAGVNIDDLVATKVCA